MVAQRTMSILSILAHEIMRIRTLQYEYSYTFFINMLLSSIVESMNLKTYAANFYVHLSRVKETGTSKVVWILSFDLLRNPIRINTAFRNSYIISMFRHFLDKIK